MHTVDRAEENFKKLCELFPNAVTETKNENGEVVRAIDADVLRQEISGEVVEGSEERYQFTWPDKKKSVVLANQPIAKTLRLEREKSVGRDGTAGSIDTENIYIEGDNLDALKLLQETYLGKVKMIYIDPPYNTGNDFVYDDDFSQDKDEYITGSGQLDEQGRQLVQNPESNGRFHTDWLNMLYPRLRIARDLLSDDGVIFISIDDNEQENLKKICDEIFGAMNFVGELVIKTATDNNPSQINTEHEFMFCYAKNKHLQRKWICMSESAIKIMDYYDLLKRNNDDEKVIQDKLRKWIKANKSELNQVAHYNCVDNKGVYSASSNSSNPHPGGYMFDILHPTTGLPCPKPQNGWRWTEKTFWEYANNGEVEWGIDETTQPHIKKRIETATEILRSVIYEDNRGTTKMLSDLFDGKKVFENPKPLSIIKKIVNYITSVDDIILDFFSGSATTAHAVMQLNAENLAQMAIGDDYRYAPPKRKFIMIQLPELTDEKSEARKAGYKTICDIGEERIRRAGKQIKEELQKKNDENKQLALKNNSKFVLPRFKLDIGFRVFRVDSSNMQNVYYAPADYKQEQLEILADNIKPDRTPTDLLFQVMLDLGITLSAEINETEIDGKKVFSVADGYLIACFDNDITEQTVTEIAKKQPFYAVFRDSGMASDSVMTNFEQIFETYSPKTVRRVL